MVHLRTVSLAAVLLALVIASAGCTSSSNQGGGTTGYGPLQTYSDQDHLFSVQKPPTWTVTVGDDVQVKAPADGTRVVFRPLFLSGSYRDASASAIANYLVGRDAQQVSGFAITSVRETTDGSMLELVASYDRSGTPMTGVYTIFVDSPYAMFTGYEASRATFSNNEPLLRSIAGSFEVLQPASSGAATSATVGSSLGPLSERQLDGGVTMKIPAGWSPQVFPLCSGLIAADPRNTRGVVFLNGLHKDPGATLPPGVSPEDYLTTYLRQDFSTISDVRILSYEDTDLSALNSGSVTAKAMRISFSNSGTPTTGSFMVGTSQVGGGYFTAVEYLWGVYAPTSAWEADAPVLLESFFSIDYSQATIAGCRNVLAASWGAGSRSGGSGGSSGSDAREKQLEDWYAKQENEDIFMEKFTDYTLNRDRVYNPETDQVYTVDQNFYQYYDTHREQYKQQNMEQLTDTQFRSHVALDGNLHIEPNA
ncbi:MAG: hypothetical protein ABFC38_11240 [Methanospirillum sp.]